MTPARDPKQKKIMINPLKIWFFDLKTPGFFRDFLGDHFARVERSGDQNLTMLIRESSNNIFKNEKNHENAG